jgi:UDP-glucose 4-epimerase
VRSRVFVTGGSGFVGAHVVRALSEAGHEVTVLARDPRRAEALLALRGVTLVVGDVADPAPWRDALSTHDACIHLALIWGDAADDLKLADLRASAQLFELAAHVGVEHMVYTSSAAVHRPWAPRMDAHDALRSADYYGATKASGEVFLSAVCQQHAMRGNVLRPGAVVGGAAIPGAPVRIDRRIAAMIDAARRGETIRVARGEGRQFIGAGELARLYVALLASGCNHERFIAVAPEVIAWEEVAGLVVAEVGAGRVAVDEGSATPPAVFDVSHTERHLGVIPSAREALREALRFLCG